MTICINRTLPLEAYLSIVLHHDVTVVSVTNAQDKSGHTITSTGSREQVNGHVIPTVIDIHRCNYALIKQMCQKVVHSQCKSSRLALVLVLQPLVQGGAVELQCPFETSFTLDLHDGMRTPHNFNKTHTVSDGQAAIGKHSVNKCPSKRTQIISHSAESYLNTDEQKFNLEIKVPEV